MPPVTNGNRTDSDQGAFQTHHESFRPPSTPTVLTKKKHFEQNRIEELIDGLFDRMDVYGPETEDLIAAYRL